MSVSACAGVNMGISFESATVRMPPFDQEGFFSADVLGFPGAQLFVEALGHVGDFLERGVLLLVLGLLELGQVVRARLS